MEKWKIIPEAPEYEISNKGRVRSNIYNESRMMRPKTKKNRYLELSLKGVDGRRIYRLVHRLVAFAFVPQVFGKPTINHEDDNKKNNRYKNLVWATYSENNAHSAHKRHAINNPKRAMKLTVVKVGKIREAHTSGEKSSVIAKQFNVSPATVRNIVYGRSWNMSTPSR